MPAIKTSPKQSMTVRIEGLRSWDGTTQPPLGTILVQDVFDSMRDYISRYTQMDSITVYTPRSLTGGGVYESGST